MKNLVIETKAMRETLFEKKLFGWVVFSAINNNVLSAKDASDLKKNLSTLLCHYQCLSFECLNLFAADAPDSDEHLLAVIALGHLRYLKEAANDVQVSYHDAFLKLRLQGDPDKQGAMLVKASQSPFKVPEEVKAIPYLYDSLLLEMPEFALKDLVSRFGHDAAVKIALSLHQTPSFFYRVNPALAKEEDYRKDSRFETLVLGSLTLFRYRKAGEKPKADIEAHKLYPLSYPEALCYSQLKLPALSPAVLLTANRNPLNGLYFGMVSNDLALSQVTAVYDDELFYSLAKDAKEVYHLASLDPLFCAKNALIKTYRDYEHYDIVVSKGHDSHLGQASLHPAILPSLTPKDIEANGALLLSDLKEASYFVKKGGSLVFYSDSLFAAETVAVVDGFLAIRPQFELILKEDVRPDILKTTGAFFAVFRRKE